MHEADRWNPSMEYDRILEKKWEKSGLNQKNIFELVLNISIDSRLNEKGFGKEKRKQNFCKLIGENYIHVFENMWNNPPKTWPEFDKNANYLLNMHKNDIV